MPIVYFRGDQMPTEEGPSREETAPGIPPGLPFTKPISRLLLCFRLLLNERQNMTTIALEPQRQVSAIWWLFLLQGVAAILIGGMLLAAPGQTLVALVHFLGFYWLITGVLELVRMFVDRSVPWLWSLVTGFIGIGAGVLVL